MRRLVLLLPALALSCFPRAAERPPADREPSAPPTADAGVPEPTLTEAPDAGTPPAPVEPRPLTLTVGGDVTLGYHHEEWFDQKVAEGASREEMFAYGFKEVKPLVPDSDLFLVNLECPFTDRGEKLPKNFNFRARTEFVQSLIAGGVDVVSLANNHLMDYGEEGLLDTLATLDAAGIAYFGAGRNLAEARKPAIVERDGIRIAFLGYFFLGLRNIEPPAVHATASTPGVAGHYNDVNEMERMLREDVRLAKSQADLVVPYFHWGRERYFIAEPYQGRLARAAIEEGASLILGSHPHVLQGMELVGAVPVIYSMGNFVFGGNWNPKPKETALYKARLSKAGYLSSEILPLRSDRYPEKPAQPYPLEGEEARQVLGMLALYSSLFETPLPELPPPPPLYWVEPPPHPSNG